MRRMTVLNGEGDVTIEWDAANDEQVKRFVEETMKKGHTFFILSDDGADQIRLRDGQFHRALGQRKLVLFGEALDPLVIGVVRAVSSGVVNEVSTTRRATTADEVVGNNTIVTRRAVGG